MIKNIEVKVGSPPQIHVHAESLCFQIPLYDILQLLRNICKKH